MDILMVFWNSVWRNTMRAIDHAPPKHSAEEWAAYSRSLERRSPIERATRRAPLQRPAALR